jgi:hypothetical protein
MNASIATAHTGARDVLADALREQLARDGALELEATGSSMEPTLPGGSVVRIEPLTGAPAHGELVALVPEGGALLCCHRVVALDERGYVLTQGDRLGAPDGFAAPDRLIGVVRSFTLGGRAYAVGPQLPRPRPSFYRIQRQRLSRALRRLTESRRRRRGTR